MKKVVAGLPAAASRVNASGSKRKLSPALSPQLIVLWLVTWLLSLASPAHAQPMAWFADGTNVYQVNASSRTLVRTLPFATSRIAADVDGGVWSISSSDAQLIKVNAAGQTTLTLVPSALNLSSFLTAVIAVDPRDGSLWMARRAELNTCEPPATCQLLLRHVSVSGQLLHSSAVTVVAGQGIALSVDQFRQPWIAAEQALIRLSEQGIEQQRIVLPASTASLLQRRLVVDPLASVAWVAEVVPGNDDRVLRVDMASIPAVVGQVGGEATASAVESVSGAFWTLASSTSQLTRYLPAGTMDLAFSIPTALGTRPELAMDPLSAALWVGGTGSMHVYSPSGQQLATIPISDTRVTAISITPFRPVPKLTLSAPPAQTATNNATPAFQLLYALECNGSPCSPPDERFGAYQLNATLDSTSVSAGFVYTPSSRSSSYVPALALSNGTHSFSASIVDRFGQESNTVGSALTIDTVAPQLTQISPADGSRTNQPALTLSGTLSEPGAVALNGIVQQGPNFGFGLTLSPGTNSLVLSATDAVGNSAQTQVVYHYLTVAISSPADGATVSAATVAVSGTFTGPSDTTVTVNAVSASISGNSYTATVPLAVGANSITVTATSAGVTASKQIAVARQSSGGGGTLNPPPVDPTVSTTVFTSTQFLYSGANPVQTGVAPGTIEPRRAAVVRGRVLDRSGQPLAGVAVTINKVPQFGQTLSRADGAFDMAVNGGGPMVISFSKAGYLPVQRSLSVPWQDFVVSDDVVMTPLDAAATTVTLDGSQSLQVARGSVMTDASGTRRATVLFPQGTTAGMVLPNGSVQPLTTLTVRATEYTVGSAGVKAMPGTLPPTSGYTYAVEISVDEAIAAGAKQVRLNQAVPIYIENFLNFPIGGAVPLGFYDPEASAWIGAPNGRVVKVLSISAGQAVLDIDGDGQSDDANKLAAIGITTAELERLATLYVPGTSLWRVQVDHFTPWDCNWPFSPPLGAGPPPSPPPILAFQECSAKVGGSIIDCENQTLGEVIPITGAPFDIHYSSDRVPGRANRSTKIVLSGSTVPVDLAGIGWRISVAGQLFSDRTGPSPNQSFIFNWDGRDAYGRVVQGAQVATVSIAFVYRGEYETPAAMANSFGVAGGDLISGNIAREEVMLWKSYSVTLGGHDAKSRGLGGWTPSVHHAYDPTDGTIYLGHGARRTRSSSDSQVISTVANVTRPTGLAVDAAGSIYVAQSTQPTTLLKLAPSGGASTLAASPVVIGGNTLSGSIRSVATNGQGNVYFDLNNGPGQPNYIIVRDSQGSFQVLAGGGALADNDGGNAANSKLGEIKAIATDQIGNVYLAEVAQCVGASRQLNRVHRVDPAGKIVRVLGPSCANFVSTPDSFTAHSDGGVSATSVAASVFGIHSISVDWSGVLYVGDYRCLSGLNCSTEPSFWVLRVTPAGVLDWFAGWRGPSTPTNSQDGQFSRSTMLGGAWVSTTATGELLVAESGGKASPATGKVRRLGSDDIFRSAAGGGGTSSQIGDQGPATGAFLAGFDADDPLDWFYAGGAPPPVLGIATNGAGELLISEQNGNRIRRVGNRLPSFNGGDIFLPSSDGAELYHFGPEGRHLRTLNSRTGAELFRFDYDSTGRLATITDVDGNATFIEHGVTGAPSAIVSPDGQRTVFSVNADGYLEDVTDPASRVHHLTYGAGGLLTGFLRPKLNESTMVYDDSGLLKLDKNAGNGYWDLSRMELSSNVLTPDQALIGYDVVRTSALGRSTTHRLEILTTLETLKQVTYPDGSKSVSKSSSDGTQVRNSADGTTFRSQKRPDPRLGMTAPLVNTTTMLPSGTKRTETTTRSVVLANLADPLSLVTETTTRSVNGKSWIDAYTNATRETVSTTPQGRTSVVRTDMAGRPTLMQVGGLNPLNLSYDTRGRLKTVTQGTGSTQRSVTYTYGTSGFVDNIVDALPQTVQYQRDAVGQPRVTTLPGNRTLGLDFDANGNLSGVTPPGRTLHSIGHNLVDLEGTYTPPAIANVADPKTSTTYNLDKELKQIDRPDGSSLVLGYNALGQLQTLTPSAGAGPVVTLGYMPTSGQLQSVTTPDAVNAFTYDGYLLKSETFTGAVVGSITLGYNSELLVNSLTVNGTATSYGYDNDGLLTQAGALSITPHEQHGMPKASTLGAVTTTQTYTGFGEPDLFTASMGGSTLYSLQLGYDRVGRVTSKTEAISGGTSAWEYGYDAAGRLETVKLGGVQVASYGYDANGNRTTVNGTVVAAFDAQDRLQSYGPATYVFGAAGDLQQIQGTQTTAYSYDIYGNLRTVVLPTATITYKVDGSNRRVAKLVNGTVVQRLLYLDQLKVAAELDGANTVVARFVYGGRPNVPEYMIKGGVTYRIITDHLGSVRLVVDSTTGAVAQRIDYDAWGQVTSDSNPGFQPFGFAGGLYDRETGLVRFGARDYDSNTGRWTAKDPIRFEGGDSNIYAYVGGNPLSYTDPRGLDNPGMGPYGPFPGSMGFRRGVPGNSCTCMMGSDTFYAPPGTNFSNVRSAGQANGWNPMDVNRNVGHWGTFDFQRDAGMNQFTGAYTKAANFGVGVYMQGAGYSRANTGRIARGFAGAFSSNAGDPNQAKYWMMGWDAANSGNLEYVCQ